VKHLTCWIGVLSLTNSRTYYCIYTGSLTNNCHKNSYHHNQTDIIYSMAYDFVLVGRVLRVKLENLPKLYKRMNGWCCMNCSKKRRLLLNFSPSHSKIRHVEIGRVDLFYVSDAFSMRLFEHSPKIFSSTWTVQGSKFLMKHTKTYFLRGCLPRSGQALPWRRHP